MYDEPRRPADRVLPGDNWSSKRATFDLDGMSYAESAGLLVQWALARHLGAEITRAGYRSRAKFAEAHGLSIHRVRNFLTGNRKANFEDLAAMVEILGPRAIPDVERLADYIGEARSRSEGVKEATQASLYPARSL